jgi:hypothetical protein
MKLNFCLAALLFVFSLSSCSDHIYGPALHHSDIAYLPKPMSSDTVKSATYLSGALVVDNSPNLGDVLTSGQFNLSRANTYNHFNLAYGAFGVLGSYQNSILTTNDPYYFKDKFFGAVGGRLSGNYFASHGHTDFRIIGFEAAYSHEFGDYIRFRREVTNKPTFYTDNRTDLVTLGLTSEVIFHSRNPHNQFGFRIFSGGTFGKNNIYTNSSNPYQIINGFNTPIFFTAAYFMQLSRFIAVIETGSFVQLRVGYRL